MQTEIFYTSKNTRLFLTAPQSITEKLSRPTSTTKFEHFNIQCPCIGITLMRMLACCYNNNKIKRIVIISYLDGLGFAYKTIVRVQVQQCGYILLLRRVIRIQEYSSRSAHFHVCVRYCLLQTMDSKHWPLCNQIK